MEKKKRLFSFQRIIRLLLFFFFLSTFLISAFHIASYCFEGFKATSLNEDIILQSVVPFVLSPEDQPSYDLSDDELQSPSVSTDEQYPDIAIDFSELAEYSDIVGWIYGKEMKIHYPVVHSEDNERYLYRLVDGSENDAGSIFLDTIDSPDLSGRVNILYGHNMKNGTMFGTILDYRNSDYFNEHPYLFYFTPSATYRLEIFAGVHTTSDSSFYRRPQNETEMNQYLSDAYRKSVFVSDVNVGPTDKIMVLSTCSGQTGDSQRFALMAKLVRIV